MTEEQELRARGLELAIEYIAAVPKSALIKSAKQQKVAGGLPDIVMEYAKELTEYITSGVSD